MIYSVWDQARRVYDYYDAPSKVDGLTSVPAPTHISSTTLGAAPDRAAWPLPSNAQPIGSGKYPRGMIAKRRGGLGGLGFFSLDFTIDNLLPWVVVGFLVWRFVLPELNVVELRK